MVTTLNLEDKLRKARVLERADSGSKRRRRAILGKKSGRGKMKRISAPRSWDIARKEARFITKPSPGTHAVAKSYSLAVVLRDLLRMVATQKEVMQVLTRGEVLVDGSP